MRKNFLRAVLLALLTFATAFFTVSCLEIDNSEPLEHISVVNVPESIRIGKFNEANIKVRIVSGTTRELFPIKEEMISEQIVDDGQSALEPTESGNYWHYDENGEIAVW